MMLTSNMRKRQESTLSSVHPILRAFFHDMNENIVRPAGGELYAFSGFRSRGRQHALFVSGRSRARYGQSWHNTRPYSLAIDVVPVFKTGIIEWSSDRTRSTLEACAEYISPHLTWGHHLFLGDWYHFQLLPESGPHNYPDIPLEFFNLKLIPEAHHT